jgi:hypothetical protein
LLGSRDEAGIERGAETDQRQVIWFLRLSPLLAVTSSSADQEVVPSFHDPETSPSDARC